MIDVLKMARPLDGAKWLEKLSDDKYAILTAEDWLALPQRIKDDLESSGLPFSVINSINRTVHVGLLLPEFKYADKVSFMEASEHKDTHQEALTIWDHASIVDASWILSRTSCQTLCENYQEMVELSQKYFLKRFSTQLYKGKGLYKGMNAPYPMTHDLLKLHDVIRKDCPSDIVPPTCNTRALNDITLCGEESKYSGARITCENFYDITSRHGDPYLLELWSAIKTYKPLRLDLDKFETVQIDQKDWHEHHAKKKKL